MLSCRKLTLLGMTLMGVLTFAFAQTIENVKTTFDGERVIITYDLNNSDLTQKFKVVLYSSHNKYGFPLHSLVGDVGENVLPGKGKRVSWEVRKELPPDFDAELSIKVKAAMIIPIIKLEAKPLAKSGYKKGQTVQVEWKGGKPSDKIHIDLYKDGALQQKLTESLGNSPQLYQWMLPKDLKGSGYSFRIANSSDQTNSGNFKVKPKIPLMLKVLPVLMIGGVVVALGGSKSTPTDPTLNNDLPGPIKPN